MTHREIDRRDAPRPAAGTRRSWLAGVAGTGAALGMGLAPGQAPAARVPTRAHVVIAGSGLAGIGIAHRLRAMLDGARITIIDARQVHHYQPGFTLVATGVWPEDKVIESNAALQPAGVEWVREMVAEFDPAANAVVTSSGRRVAYDYLVVATGTHQDWAQIEGMDVKAIGSNGLGSVYPGSHAAGATWGAMDAFRQKGGQAVMTLPATPLKCAGAPLKMTFMLRDRLAQAGTLERSTVSFYSALHNVFGVKPVNDLVVQRWTALGLGLGAAFALLAWPVMALACPRCPPGQRPARAGQGS